MLSSCNYHKIYIYALLVLNTKADLTAVMQTVIEFSNMDEFFTVESGMAILHVKIVLYFLVLHSIHDQ